MKTLFSSLLLALVFQIGITQKCQKCDIKPLKVISKTEEPNLQQIKSFICTLDASCQNNVEFSEFSNELVWKLITQDAKLFNQALHDLGWKYVKLVCDELENPIEGVNLQQIFTAVWESHTSKDIIYTEQIALKKAAQKVGIKLIEKDY